MEFKRVWMPYKNSVNPEKGIVEVSPKDDESTYVAEDKVRQLLNDGWQIVSTAPVTGSFAVYVTGNSYDVSYTTGIEIFLVK